MRIRRVDFPVELIEAHRAGKLVIFVGAGASRDAPSSLPDFRRLTRVVAAKAQAETSEDDLKQPDVFLGRLADKHVDVHQMVAASIGVPTSEPNRLHKALAELSVVGGPVRIVTTNYDLHLSTALRDRGVQFSEYVGPALPMGDDFTGVVYLHGNLRGEPRHLVVTDRDFGRAYLRDAWAARFLDRMFAEFTVLFVGYSHSDVVMRYLTRALGAGALRYALTSVPHEADWRAFDIRPVGYSMDNESHVALVDAVERWGSRASMGLLDHRQRVADLVSGPPPQEPEDVSYLETVLADPHQVRLFAEFARGVEWLKWATTQPEFARMFDPNANPTDCMSTLANWFAERFVAEEKLTAEALGVVRDAGGRLGPTLWSAVGRQLHRLATPRPAWLGPWLVLLVQYAPEGMRADWLEFALAASCWPDDRSVALLLFDYLTEPLVEARPPFGVLGGAPRFTIRLRGSSHYLDEAWRDLFVPNLAVASSDVTAIADRQLRRAFSPARSGRFCRADVGPSIVQSLRDRASSPGPTPGVG